MAGQNQGVPNMDQFEVYFRRADLDGDGRITGAEAVNFFQGSNLPKNVLAQIWMHADQRKTGFLGRPEFYNALRLVTVAQSKRELTPDIVKAALYGPAAAKIPAPQINLPAAHAPQSNALSVAPAPQMSTTAPTAAPNFGYRGQGVPIAGVNQQYFPSQSNQSIRPPQAMPAGFASQTLQGLSPSEPSRGVNFVGSSVPHSSSSNEWLRGRTGATPTGPRGISPSVPSPVSTSSQVKSNNSIAVVVSGNGLASDPTFGGDSFSATPSALKQEPSVLHGASSGAASSAIFPVSAAPQPSKHGSLDSLQSALSMQLSGGQAQSTQMLLTPTQKVPAAGPLASAGVTVGVGNSTSRESQPPWPKMKPSDVQKYTKVFLEVDTDRDGIITGEEARNLFLSWRLPREVLKQVWYLSDQDSDSMLSLREFCFALYLMERYREGRPLPAALPSNVMFDETLLSMTGQRKVTYGNAGFTPHQGVVGPPSMVPTSARSPMPTSAKADGPVQSTHHKSVAPVLDDSFLNQRENGQRLANPKPQEAKDAEKKVGESEDVLLDSKEKIDFYRTKMQELVLYKSRCDNRLNEITERASADKREAESLAKKYEEKYKQVAEIASKLTMEEAKFRDIQERKAELNQAIIKMEQGGSADGILQVRADRIQSDLEELVKAITERCKKHGLEVKSAAIFELPIGWQPGISEEAAVWDEDWDKFEDEGFANVLGLDAKAAPKQRSTAVQSEIFYPDYNSDPDSSSNANGRLGNPPTTVDHGLESESEYSHSEDEFARSPRDSPAGKTTQQSPSRKFSDVHYAKSFEADTETHRSFDEPNWGTFDNNNDVDSVWGFNPTSSKELESEKNFFEHGDFSSIKTESPRADTLFQRKSPIFEDSVPATPVSRFGNSSPRYSEAGGDQFYDNFSRFDSFSMHEGGFSPKREQFSRFDSINSSKDFGQSLERFSRFDSISSTRDFGQNTRGLTRFDSINSTRDFGQTSQNLTRFDSINSSGDFGHSGTFSSFDDSDPFGSSGPFKVTSESQTSKGGSENWKAF